jgi:hypothetical protein
VLPVVAGIVPSIVEKLTFLACLPRSSFVCGSSGAARIAAATKDLVNRSDIIRYYFRRSPWISRGA